MFNRLIPARFLIISLFAVGVMSVSIAAPQDSLKQTSYSLVKPQSCNVPNSSGDMQCQSVGLGISKPVKVQVLNDNLMPAANIPVYFSTVSTPKEATGFKIHDKIVYTDADGIARTYVTLGSVEGEYEIAAKISGNNTENTILTYKLFARKSNWLFMLIIGLLGGLALFLLGMDRMSKGLQKSAGNKVRTVLSSLTNNRFMAVGVGIFITMVIQSSSVVSVMLVSFVDSGLMAFAQTIGVILGASIGATLTVQLIAFRFTDYALLIVGVGAVMYFMIRNERFKNIGETILGFGVIFFGMYVMSDSISPLKTYEPFMNFLIRMENPFLGITIGIILTALVQSSSAFMGILIILSTQGLISLEASVSLLFGSHIGTSVTAIIASAKANREARKVAAAHTLFKTLSVLIFVWWINPFADFIRQISPQIITDNESMNVLAGASPRQIANAHTIFIVAFAILAIPFTRLFARLVDKILPVKPEEEELPFNLRYIDNSLIETPSLALSLAKQEIIRMSYIVQSMVRDVIYPFFEHDEKKIQEIEKKEAEVDFLRDKIKDYLIKISRGNVKEDIVDESFQMMYTLKEFEQIADIASTNLSKQAKKWINDKLEFSEEGKKEITDYHISAIKQIGRAIESFKEMNLQKAEVMKKKFKEYADMEIQLERFHYNRLTNEVDRSLTSSNTHIELISMFKAITAHATNIARMLLELSESKNTTGNNKTNRKRKPKSS